MLSLNLIYHQIIKNKQVSPLFTIANNIAELMINNCLNTILSDHFGVSSKILNYLLYFYFYESKTEPQYIVAYY